MSASQVNKPEKDNLSWYASRMRWDTVANKKKSRWPQSNHLSWKRHFRGWHMAKRKTASNSPRGRYNFFGKCQTIDNICNKSFNKNEKNSTLKLSLKPLEWGDLVIIIFFFFFFFFFFFADFCPPSMWHEIRWYTCLVGKFRCVINGARELKKQGADSRVAGSWSDQIYS